MVYNLQYPGQIFNQIGHLEILSAPNNVINYFMWFQREFAFPP